MEVYTTLDEILVIRESLPIFYYNRNPDQAFSEDWYVLQSGFFVALSQFANELSADKLKLIVLENRLYALDEASDILLIFGNIEKMTQEVVTKLQNDISKATNYLNYLVEKHKLSKSDPLPNQIDYVAKDFGDYLKQEDLVEDDAPFDPQKSRSLMQKFIFKSIGYKPGQCNIGPAERLKRMMSGLTFLGIGILGALIIGFTGASPYFTLILFIPFFLGVEGVLQYFFKFCAINGLTKRYNMK